MEINYDINNSMNVDCVDNLKKLLFYSILFT